MKLNTNIPKWPSHRAASFGNAVLAPLNQSFQKPLSERSKWIPQQKPNSNSENPTAPPNERAHTGSGCRMNQAHWPVGANGGCRWQVGEVISQRIHPSITGSKSHIKEVAALWQLTYSKSSPPSLPVRIFHMFINYKELYVHTCVSVWYLPCDGVPTLGRCWGLETLW